MQWLHRVLSEQSVNRRAGMPPCERFILEPLPWLDKTIRHPEGGHNRQRSTRRDVLPLPLLT